MRLIDADACPALFDAEFKETKRLILDGEKHLDNLAEGFLEASSVIKSMPTIDAAPVVHGRWIIRYDGQYGRRRLYCSACENHSGIGGIIKNQKKPYCPNCGAKMDMEQEQPTGFIDRLCKEVVARGMD